MTREEKYVPTQIRLPKDVFDGLKELRERGYLPTALMRRAIAAVVKQKLAESNRRGND